MIDLTNHPDPVRVFNNALEPGINPRGTYIAYHEGDYSDHVGLTPIGKSAYQAYESGRVILCQKRIQEEPRRYVYYAVVR